MAKGTGRTCSKEGCNAPHHAKGLCMKHYMRRLRATNPAVRENERECQRQRRTDPGVKARGNDRRRERYADDPAYRARRNTETRERYHRMGGDGYRRWLGTLLMEQGFACGICGRTITADRADVHHVRPVSKGGGNEKANLVAACPSCNRRLGNR